jgi:predicted ArsR family transcriptional regulator
MPRAECYRLADPRGHGKARSLVLHGASTSQVADQLVISPHTVKEHLKNIFTKTGVRSRRDLVGIMFFTHYELRFRDNEQRVRTGAPMRGGPLTR